MKNNISLNDLKLFDVIKTFKSVFTVSHNDKMYMNILDVDKSNRQISEAKKDIIKIPLVLNRGEDNIEASNSQNNNNSYNDLPILPNAVYNPNYTQNSNPIPSIRIENNPSIRNSTNSNITEESTGNSQNSQMNNSERTISDTSGTLLFVMHPNDMVITPTSANVPLDNQRDIPNMPSRSQPSNVSTSSFNTSNISTPRSGMFHSLEDLRNIGYSNPTLVPRPLNSNNPLTTIVNLNVNAFLRPTVPTPTDTVPSGTYERHAEKVYNYTPNSRPLDNSQTRRIDTPSYLKYHNLHKQSPLTHNNESEESTPTNYAVNNTPYLRPLPDAIRNQAAFEYNQNVGEDLIIRSNEEIAIEKPGLIGRFKIGFNYLESKISTQFHKIESVYAKYERVSKRHII
jgi:hypothetical protein